LVPIDHWLSLIIAYSFSLSPLTHNVKKGALLARQASELTHAAASALGYMEHLNSTERKKERASR
jgi:hypothetical protein